MKRIFVVSLVLVGIVYAGISKNVSRGTISEEYISVQDSSEMSIEFLGE